MLYIFYFSSDKLTKHTYKKVFSFIISKKLYHTSFKLNIVYVPRDFLPSPPLNPRKG